MIYETAKNYKPDLILLGHSYDIENETLERIKDFSKNTVISQWFEDHLADTGPDFSLNRKKLLKYDNFIKSNFITTHPSTCLLYTSPSPRDRTRSRMPSSA